jgi:hypothetical protein
MASDWRIQLRGYSSFTESSTGFDIRNRDQGGVEVIVVMPFHTA